MDHLEHDVGLVDKKTGAIIRRPCFSAKKRRTNVENVSVMTFWHQLFFSCEGVTPINFLTKAWQQKQIDAQDGEWMSIHYREALFFVQWRLFHYCGTNLRIFNENGFVTVLELPFQLKKLIPCFNILDWCGTMMFFCKLVIFSLEQPLSTLKYWNYFRRIGIPLVN